jgi:hypothetical protein
MALAPTKPRILGLTFCALDLGQVAADPARAPWAARDPGDDVEVAVGEDLVWKCPHGWFQLTIDADFVAKRGRSFRPRRSRSRRGGSSASMSWAR